MREFPLELMPIGMRRAHALAFHDASTYDARTVPGAHGAIRLLEVVRRAKTRAGARVPGTESARGAFRAGWADLIAIRAAAALKSAVDRDRSRARAHRCDRAPPLSIAGWL